MQKVMKLSIYRIAIGRSPASRSLVRGLATTIVGATAESIVDQCLDLRKSLQPVNDRFAGPLEKSAQKNTVLPFVFLLGNHSSGKSSFVNYVLQRKVQVAGVAPTDDTFTVIVPGPSDVDKDGATLIGDPDMGFSGLKAFGPNLIHHTQLKIRSNISAKNFAMVDTPGMIDSPIVRLDGNSSRAQASDRGYDFEGVCRWYGERADVILLFFDPDKPGTTGETLSILTNALSGLDHKLYIILNKADQFKKIHDFARAYGALCWNLSKVIYRKDLPRIYTMCLPTAAIQANTSIIEDVPSFAQGLRDLEDAREEIIKEVLNTPKRRSDNEITRVSDAASLLHLHIVVMNAVLDRHDLDVRKSRLIVGSTTLFSFLLSGTALSASLASNVVSEFLGLTVSLSLSSALGFVSFSAMFIAGSLWWSHRFLFRRSNDLYQNDLVGGRAFGKIYAKQIAENDETILAMWSRVREHIKANSGFPGSNEHVLTEVTKKTNKRQRNADLKTIDDILNKTVPTLRRKSSPTFHK